MTARHGSITDFVLKLSDLALLTASLGLTIVYRYAPSQNPTFVIDYLSERVKVTNAILGFVLLLSWYAAFAAQGLYVSHRLSSLRGELREIARAVAISSLALLVAAQLGKWPTINVLTVGGFGVAGFVLVAAGRGGLRLHLRRLWAHGHNVKAPMIFRGGPRGRRFAAQVKQRNDLRYRLLGHTDTDPA